MLCAHTNRVIVNHSELQGLDGINNVYYLCIFCQNKIRKKREDFVLPGTFSADKVNCIL